jgi:pimeloyl-ACP methyl ester carboxylesterase
MTFAARLLDRLVLKPTRSFVDPEDRRQQWIDSPLGRLETWVLTQSVPTPSAAMLALKFPGAGGRAERGGIHPFDRWSNVDAEIWAVNMPGYGGSAGRATLQSIPIAAHAIATAASQARGNRLLLVIGNSIGCSAALYVASRFDASGVLLRNPVPLRELLRAKHAWWNRGWLSEWLIRRLPGDLDPVANAARCTVPALFIQSGHDTLVSPTIQAAVIDRYAGPKQVFVAAGIDHHEPISDADLPGYFSALEWLYREMTPPSTAR